MSNQLFESQFCSDIVRLEMEQLVDYFNYYKGYLHSLIESLEGTADLVSRYHSFSLAVRIVEADNFLDETNSELPFQRRA